MWLRVSTRGGLLQKRQWNFGFHKMRGMSWLAEDWLAFQKIKWSQLLLLLLLLSLALQHPMGLAFLVVLFHSALSLHCFLHPFTRIPIICTSSSISTSQLFLGLSLIPVPIGFHSNIFGCYLVIHPHHVTQPGYSSAFYKSHYICVFN